MVYQRWALALLALAVASTSCSSGVLADPSGFHLRIHIVESEPLWEDANATLSDTSAASDSEDDNGNGNDDSSDDIDSEEPDADDGPDGVGDGYDIDWTNWSWPDDVTPDIWGDSVGPFGQCGGAGYDGNETCILNWVCAPLSDSFSECLPSDWVTIVVAPTTGTPATSTPAADSPTVDGNIDAPATEKPVIVIITPSSNAPGAPYPPLSGSDSSDRSGSGGSSAQPSPAATPVATTVSPSPSPASAPPTTTTTTPGDIFQFDTVPAWLQCGGRNFNYYQYASSSLPLSDTTKLRCWDGYQCDVVNEWFFQCVPIHDPSSAALWSQCGGEFHQGLTNCVAGSYCKLFNQWYSQCVPAKA